MLLGHARGKVGDLVFSRTNGQQVVRARASVVKNPQTEAQMIQRILLNTVIQAYSRMSEICDHSFEGIPVGQQSMGVFMRRNLAQLRQYVADGVNVLGYTFDDLYAFAPLGTNEFTMNPFVISAGSLPSVTITDISALNGAKIAVVAAGATLTYEDVITSLGLQRGDQLTFISQEAWTDRRAAFNYARVILDPRDANGAALPLDTAFLSGTAINMPNPRNEGAEITYAYANGSLTFNRSDNAQFGAAVIVSRQKSDGSWLRSNTSITLVDGVAQLVNSRSLQECLDLFTAGSIDTVNPLYLNNARRLTGASTGTQGGFTYSFGTLQPNQDIEQPTAGELQLVAARLTTVDGTPTVVATDINGVDYVVFSNNSYSSYYGKKLSALEGNTETAWTTASETSGDNRVYTGTIPAVLITGTGYEDQPINPMTLWLQSQGVSIAVFVNP